MQITVVGLGYVGLVTAACLADWGHRVTGIEADRKRVDALRAGDLPFHEPGLEELVERNAETGRLEVCAAEEAGPVLEGSEVVFVAVGTHDRNGGWQTETMTRCLAETVPQMGPDSVLVIRSTLPPDFVARLPETVAEMRRGAGRAPIPVAVNPEFTQEGRAVSDFLEPERVILGVAHDDDDGAGMARLERVYAAHVDAPVLTMSAVDAMLSKLGANLFLATKISFANELASLCDLHGASVEEVVRGMSYDRRIGGSFLRAGIGFGGSCLPQQVSMTVASAGEAGTRLPLLASVDQINRRQRVLLVDRLAQMLGGSLQDRRVALLGLTFKAGTDDLREAPSLSIAGLLVERGARPVAYDPMPRARAAAAGMVEGLEVAETAMEALTGADAAALVTEWPEFRELDWAEAAGAMRTARIVDGRNFLSPPELVEAGFEYRGFGRPPIGDGAVTPSAYEQTSHSAVGSSDRRPEGVPNRA